jgi:hypothetical protein
MAKPEIEFTSATDAEVTTCTGSVPALVERILAVDPAESLATRILYFPPDTDTGANGVQTHDFWEEVYILAGSMTDLSLGRSFHAGDYACRPPGMKHGPWLSGPNGCQTFEVRYR